MVRVSPVRTLRDLISQTPLIIDQSRDGPRFQNALSGLSTSQLQAFYRRLNAEERRRFHYVANVCLGYESWSRLFQELVVQETQARLADRLEDAYAYKSAELRQREERLEAERQDLEEQLMELEAENQALHQENRRLREELERVRNAHLGLKNQQEQTLKLIERYKGLIADLRRFLPEAPVNP
jgi:regulator of replication initiation timing